MSDEATGEEVALRNREVLDAVRVRRGDLYESVLALERALAVPAGDAQEAWAAMLAAHIRGTEGPEGLFEQIRDEAPHLLNAVDKLGSQHEPLAAAADALADRLGQVSSDEDVDEVRDRTLGLLRDLLEHRHHGAELLYDAYQVDISSGD